DSHSVVMIADASAKAIVINDDNDAGDGVDLTDGGYDLSVYGNITIENVAALVVSTGTWKQMANGNITNPNSANDIYTYQIDDNITATATGDFWVDEDLILGDSSVLTLTGYSLGMYPDNNDFITIATAASISGGTIEIRSTGDLTHGALTIPTVTIKPTNMNDSSITMTGNWSIDDLLISGNASSDTEAEAMTVDANTYNLTIAGTLGLGDDTGAGYYGKIDFGSGTHTIAEDINVTGTTNTWGYIDLDNAQVSVAGNVDLNRSTVYQGLGTVTFNATDTNNTIDSWTQTFNDVVFNSATGGWTLTGGMMVADDFTMTNTAAAGIVLDGYELTVGDNFTLSAGSLFANNSTIIIKGNWNSAGGTFEPGVSTVIFNGTDVDNIITTSGETFTNFSISDGLVGYWKLDETASPALDSSGHSIHGTWTSAPAATSLTPDVNFVDPYSLDFNGTSDYVRVPSDELLNLTRFTVAFWMYADTDSDTASVEQPICKAVSGSNDSANYVFAWSHSSASVQNSFHFYDGSSWEVAQIVTTMNSQTWYHVVGTYDGTNLKVYLNGALEDTEPAGDPITGNYDLFLGSGQDSNNPGDYFEGKVDDVRIYDRALSAAEIARLAQGDQPQTAVGQYTIQDALNVDGDLILATGTLDVNGQDINVAQSWINYGGILDEETQSVTFDGGTSGHVIQSGSQTFYNLIVNGTSGGWTLYDDLEVTNTFNITDGTLTHSTDLPITEVKANTVINGGTFTGVASSIANVGNLTLSSGQYTTPSKFLTITENFSHTAGTLTASSGTIMFSSNDTSNTIDQNAQAFNNVIIGDGLIGYWKLDETAEDSCSGGEDSCDFSGYGNHGTFGGDPTISTTLPRPFRFDNQRSVDFDGTGDYVDISDSQFDITGHISVAAWAYIRAYPETDTIVSKAESSGYALEIGDDGFFQFAVHNGAGYIIADGNSAINTSQWYHLVGIWDGSNVRLYQNGILQTDAPAMTGSISTNDYALSIGSNPGATRSGYLNGIVDDVRIYNRALLADEIKTLAQAEVHGDNDNSYTLSDALDANGDITLSQGTFITGGQNINVGGSWTNYDVTYMGSTSSVTFDSTSGDQNITSNGYTFYNVVLNNTDASSSTDDIVLQDNLNVDKDIAILDGDFQGGSYTLNVAGLWTMATAGTFTAGTSTVEFDDANKVTILTGNTAFYDFLINTASKRIDFQAGSTTTVSNAVTLDGQAAGTMVDLNSTSPGTQWTINTPTANANIDYVNVQDSISANATLQALNSTDSLNNIFWFFGMIGGFNDAAVGDWNACATWNKCPGSAIGVNYPGSVDQVTIDSHEVTLTADAYTKSIVVNDDVGGAAVNLTDGGYDLNVYGDITVEGVYGLVTSTGTWRQMEDGTMSGPYSDLMYVYEIADGVTATLSSGIRMNEKLILGNSSTLNIGNSLALIYPDADDFITMGTGASIEGTGGNFYIRSSATISQGALNIPTIDLFYDDTNGGDLSLTGDWSVNDLVISGTAASDTEAEAPTINMGTSNLTMAGSLQLGNDTGAGYFGKIDFGSGTHTIAGNIDIDGTTNTWGYIDFDHAQVSVGGNVDFNRTTVYPGLGTVTFNAADTGNTIDSWTQTFNDVVFNNAAGGWILTSGMMVADDFTVTDTAAAGVSLAGYQLTVGDNVTLTGGSLFSNGSNFIIKGNWDSQVGTFEPGISTVIFNATDADNTITTNAQTFNNFMINDGLVGYWKLDETASPAIDSSGHGNYGTWVASATSSTETPSVNFVNDRSISLNGTTDRISIPDNDLLDLQTAITISAWVRMDSVNATEQGIVGKADTSAYGVYNLIYDGNTGQVFRLELMGVSDAYVYGTTVPNQDTWYHVAGTYSGSQKCIYVNGIAENCEGTTGSITTNNLPLSIGTHQAYEFDGYIDEVRVYNRALTAAEVARLAMGDQPQTATGKYSLVDALNVDGDLILATGTLDVNGQDINVQESWYNYGGILDEGNQAVTMDGTISGHVLQSGGQTFYDLAINGNSGEWTLGDNLEVSNNFNITDGTLTHSTDLPVTVITANTTLDGGTFTGVASSIVNDGNLTLTSGVFNAPANELLITGNFSSAATTFEAGNGTVIFSAPDTDGTITTNAETFYNFSLGDGLVGYWPLNETADDGSCDGSNDACDYSGYGRHGEWYGNPAASTNTPKPFRFANSRSLAFDGTGDYINIPDTVLNRYQGTVSLWFKTNSIAAGDIWAFGNLNNTTGDRVYIYRSGSNIGARLDDTSFFGSTAIIVGRWYHAALVWRTNNTGEFYVNGSSAGTVSSLTYSPNIQAAVSIAAQGGSASPWNGSLDDVRVYNRALSATEIKAISQVEVFGDRDNTYTLQDALDVDENILLAKGTLISGGVDISVGAGWNNSGATYTGSTSSVTFNAAEAGHLIRSNSSTFHNVIFNDGGGDSGGWSLSDALETGYLFTVTASDSVNGVNLSGYDLTVGGDFIVTAAGEVTASNSTIKVGGNWTNLA
ncbi:MAG: LamG domain-containing protein, partial [Candidatus Omnitrophica bacterium]|nr:LamG domain-containing protein [Candidatus Omnitrophota bacterium]